MIKKPSKPIVALVLMVIALVLIPTFRFRDIFFSITNVDWYEALYSNSQYVIGERSTRKIDDAELYIYAGYAYTRWEDPATINFEHPPLGKYVLGLSYRLFHNSVIINLVIYAGILWLINKLSWQLTQEYLPGLLSILVIGSLSIFQIHVKQGLLDLQQLLITLLFFVTIFSEKTKLRKKYLLAGLWLGILSAIKYPFPLMIFFILILGSWAFIEKQIKYFFFALPAMVAVYLASYFVYFWHHPNPINFLKFEWYRFKWWTGDRRMPKFLILQTLFTGRFQAWWAAQTYETASDWTILWPALFLGQLFMIGQIKFKNAFKKPLVWIEKNKKVLVIFGYGNLLLALYALGSAAYARYLIQLIPFWTIMIGWGVSEILKKKKTTSPS